MVGLVDEDSHSSRWTDEADITRAPQLIYTIDPKLSLGWGCNLEA